jgi:hypothetical protein
MTVTLAPVNAPVSNLALQQVLMRFAGALNPPDLRRDTPDGSLSGVAAA